MSATAATRKRDKAWESMERKKQKQALRERERPVLIDRRVKMNQMVLFWPTSMSFFDLVFSPCAAFQGFSVWTKKTLMQTPGKYVFIQYDWPSQSTKDRANSGLTKWMKGALGALKAEHCTKLFRSTADTVPRDLPQAKSCRQGSAGSCEN